MALTAVSTSHKLKSRAFPLPSADCAALMTAAPPACKQHATTLVATCELKQPALYTKSRLPAACNRSGCNVWRQAACLANALLPLCVGWNACRAALAPLAYVRAWQPSMHTYQCMACTLNQRVCLCPLQDYLLLLASSNVPCTPVQLDQPVGSGSMCVT